jgi:hypothetical protein
MYLINLQIARSCLVLFGQREKRKSKWKVEYDYRIYKIYDWNKSLTGYFFPEYASEIEQGNTTNYKDIDDHQQENEEYSEDKIIETMNKKHKKVRGGNLMIPMLKLNLLDNEAGINLDYTIRSLEENLQRANKWKEWLERNHIQFRIVSAALYTSREDRNMLSVVLYIDSTFILEQKEIGMALNPVLDKLHEDDML